jgi:hypothetical protein
MILIHQGQQRSSDPIAKWLHALLQCCLRKLADATQNEGAEILVPVAVRSDGSGFNPILGVPTSL